MHRLAELPHNVGVLRGAVVQAVGNRDGLGAGDGDVAVGLSQREAGAHVRIQLGVAAGRIGGNGHAAAGLLIDAQHAGVRMVGLDGIAAHVAVILVHDEIARAQRRGGHELLQGLNQAALVGALVLLQLILPLRAGIRAVILRSLIRNGAGRGIHDDLALVADDQVVALGDLADLGAGYIPVLADFAELLHVLRSHNGAHALLGLGGEDLCRGHILRAQRHVIEVDLHASIAGGSQLGGSAGQARAAQVLNANDHAGVVEVQAALDEDLLGEGVAHLHGRQLALGAVLEGIGGQHGHAADAIQTGAGAEEHDLIALARCKGQLQVIDLEGAHAQGIDQRVTGIGLIKDGLAANIGQAQGVAVATHAGNNARQDTLGIGGVGRPKAQLIHHGNRASAHSHDVADDAAHAGGRTLVRLHVGGVVVGLHAEGHRVAVSDIHHAGVLTNAGEDLLPHLLSHGLTKVTQVRLGRLIGAVLGPHDGVHGQLRIGGATAQDIVDALVLVVLQAEFRVGLLLVRGGLRLFYGVIMNGHENGLLKPPAPGRRP